MNLIEDFSNSAAARLTGIALAAALTMSMTGCATVERVGAQSLKRGTYNAAEAVAGTIRPEARFTGCPTREPTPVAPANAPLTNKLVNILNRTFELTIVPTIGDAGCTGQTGILPSPQRSDVPAATGRLQSNGAVAPVVAPGIR